MIICYFAVCTGVVWDYSFLYTIPFVSIQKHTFAFCYICLLLIDYCCHVMFMNTQRKWKERERDRARNSRVMDVDRRLYVGCMFSFIYLPDYERESMISLFHFLQLRTGQ